MACRVGGGEVWYLGVHVDGCRCNFFFVDRN